MDKPPAADVRLEGGKRQDQRSEKATASAPEVSSAPDGGRTNSRAKSTTGKRSGKRASGARAGRVSKVGAAAGAEAAAGRRGERDRGSDAKPRKGKIAPVSNPAPAVSPHPNILHTNPPWGAMSDETKEHVNKIAAAAVD